MNFDEYQKKAHSFAVYKQINPKDGINTYPFLGLASEVGEVASIIKRIERGDYDTPTPPHVISKLLHELGDVLWYLSECATVCGISLDEAAEVNIHRLADRLDRGVIKGEGSDR